MRTEAIAALNASLRSNDKRDNSGWNVSSGSAASTLCNATSKDTHAVEHTHKAQKSMPAHLVLRSWACGIRQPSAKARTLSRDDRFCAIVGGQGLVGDVVVLGRAV